MLRRTLPLALLLIVLSGCSTMQRGPSNINPPPVSAGVPCATPEPLAKSDTAQTLGAWTIAWIGAYGCAENKRKQLFESWPK